MFHLLCFNGKPMKVSAICASNKEAVSSFKECTVHHKIDWFLFENDFSSDWIVLIKRFPNGLRVFAISFGEISKSLSFLCVVVVGFAYPRSLSVISTNKLTTANEASKPLTSWLISIFLGAKRATGRTLFLGMKKWRKNCSYPSPKVFKSAFINSLYPLFWDQ